MSLFRDLKRMIGRSSDKEVPAAIPEVQSEPPPSVQPTSLDERNTVAFLFHRNLLQPKMKKVYDRLLEGLDSWERRIPIGVIDEKIAGKIYEDIMWDNPYLFYIGKHFTIITDNDIVSIEPEYITDRNTAADYLSKFNIIVDQLRPKMTSDKFLNERIVHDYVSGTTRYPEGRLENSRYFSPIGALIDHVAVCEGTSEATAYLMCELGIPCCVICGRLLSSNENHAWNLVRIRGKNYHLDVTNDNLRGETRYIYYNLSDRQMAFSHRWEDPTECNDESKRYIGENGFIVKDITEAESVIRCQLKSGVTEIFLIFESSEYPVIGDFKTVVDNVAQSVRACRGYEIMNAEQAFMVRFT